MAYARLDLLKSMATTFEFSNKQAVSTTCCPVPQPATKILGLTVSYHRK